MDAITINIRNQLDVMVSKIHELLFNIVQKPDTQHEVLHWIGACLYANNKRFQVFL